MTVVINGTTGITTPGETNTGTLSVTGIITASQGVGGTPAFSAYFSGTQSVSSNTITKVTVNTEVFDTASCFNNTGSTVGGIPAYAFLPNVAGYYQVNFAVEGSGVASTIQAINAIPYKNNSIINGITYSYGAYVYPTAVSGGSSTGTILVYMNGSTDFLELYGKVIGTTTIFGAGYFSAFFVRSA